MLEWPVEGRNIKTAKTTKITTWSLEPEGVKTTKDTSGVLKCQKSLLKDSGMTPNPIQKSQRKENHVDRHKSVSAQQMDLFTLSQKRPAST
jgi:hypothetical protein